MRLKYRSEFDAQEHVKPEFWLANGEPSTEMTGSGDLAVFKMPGSLLRNVLSEARLCGDVDLESDQRAIFAISQDSFSVSMRRRSVFARARVPLVDAAAIIPTSEIAFEYPLALVDRLAENTIAVAQRIETHSRCWGVRVLPGHASINLTLSEPDPGDIKPWRIADRRLVSKIDPKVLREALTFAALGADKGGAGQFSSVEIKDGVARGCSLNAIACASGEALVGVDLSMAANDIPHACRILKRMNPHDTQLWEAGEFRFITSSNLELAIMIPKVSQPTIPASLTSPFDDAIELKHDALLFGLGIAGPLGGKGFKVELDFERRDERILWKAQNARGRFSHGAPILLADEADGLTAQEGERAGARQECVQPLAGRVDHQTIERVLAAMKFPEKVKLKTTRNMLMLEVTYEGLQLRAALSTLGRDDHDVSNDE
ncbi:hypothetical protein ABE438_16120 [Bosea sp. TWI1241]|uniref:hypothetical protein n=1 Tax=Bosea sp. TWI1241 TaxID=3148904 RepID=UPI00320AFC65